jgi:beta-lactam-binding protein with PASTA domain
MPDLIGENFTQAALAIIHAGFSLAPLQNPPSASSAVEPSSQPQIGAATSPQPSTQTSPAPATPAASVAPGTVIAQAPAAGTRIVANSTVQLIVQP